MAGTDGLARDVDVEGVEDPRVQVVGGTDFITKVIVDARKLPHGSPRS